MISLASDNNSGVHPAVFEAMQKANKEFAIGYGDDPWTAKATELFKETFGSDTEVLFVFNGTGANVLAINTLCHSFEAVICPESAHINEDEAGAPEKLTGAKLLPVHTNDGKLKPGHIEPFMGVKGFVHANQPAMISISQATENGTVYSIEELKALTTEAHRHGLLVHMDGARIANAAVAQQVGLREISRDCGVDVLSFGATKNGLMMGEAVLFFGQKAARHAANYRKQNAQLFSKMRFVAAQFIPYFEQNLWQDNARHANQMARYLGQQLDSIPGIRQVRPVEANSAFVQLPAHIIPQLQEDYFFYIWEAETHVVRLMASFNTEKAHLDAFINRLKTLMQ